LVSGIEVLLAGLRAPPFSAKVQGVEQAPAAIAYGACFGVGAVVGGTVCAGQAVGQGVKVGAKAVEMKAKQGAEAIAHGAEKIGELFT
jgi:hypothetical protein